MIPPSCKPHIDWAFSNGKFHAKANEWYKGMEKSTGVEPSQATYEDFQRLFKCHDLFKSDCNDSGLDFPLQCSLPPCNECSIIPGSKYL